MSTGILTEYWDGLGNHVSVGDETLARVRAALEAMRPQHSVIPPVVVAWEGAMPPVALDVGGGVDPTLRLEQGGTVEVVQDGATLRVHTRLPLGYHTLHVRHEHGESTATLISAPVEAYRRPGPARSWGVATHLAALRSTRSRSVGDLRDLETLCDWVRSHGGDLTTILPLLPTFNDHPADPSPYAPVTRLQWSELLLDLGPHHHPTGLVARLDVARAAEEVRAALAGVEPTVPDPDDHELVAYAMFRAAQHTLGRNWRDWPERARRGQLDTGDHDAEVFRFQLAAQQEVRRQLGALRERLDARGMRLGLDLAVGVHPDGYDTWSRQHLFVESMSVGAPPDAGFPSGQDWGFRPVHPEASRAEGHAYLRSAIAHQMQLAGVLRIDHIMAWSRLYWIPQGMPLSAGTYVEYPSDELFAILTLESHRHRCEVVGENLGTVPEEIFTALPRHRIWGMYLAQFAGHGAEPIVPPTTADVALIGTHDTPTLAGWIAGADITDRVRSGLLAPDEEAEVRAARAGYVTRLALHLDVMDPTPQSLLQALLAWLGRSDAPLVIAWLEDLWLEESGVNLPGTNTDVAPNWQRPMARLLDEVMGDEAVVEAVRGLERSRNT